MALTISKKQINEAVQLAVTSVLEKHKPAMLNAQTDTELLVDELIELDAKLKKADVATINKRVTVIKGELQSIAKDNPPTEQVVFTASLGQVVLSAASNTVEITDPIGLINDLITKFGAEAAASVVKIGLTDLKKLLSENEINKYAVQSYGSRTSKIIPKK